MCCVPSPCLCVCIEVTQGFWTEGVGWTECPILSTGPDWCVTGGFLGLGILLLVSGFWIHQIELQEFCFPVSLDCSGD